jgi:hypothetical protein
MRLTSTLVFLGCSLLTLATTAQAGDRRDAVKSGILPNGGFYTVYEVRCADTGPAAIANVDSRWCTAPTGELTCFRTPTQAKDKACSAAAVAATDTGGNEATN